MPDMDIIDQKIAAILQADSRSSSASLAEAVGVSVSTASERVRRLTANGDISGWRASLKPTRFGIGLCAFILIDMAYEGEEEARTTLVGRPEVQELHHISGAHSYVAKVRVPDTAAMQAFLQEVVKPLAAVIRTESMIVMDTAKETTEIGLPE